MSSKCRQNTAEFGRGTSQYTIHIHVHQLESSSTCSSSSSSPCVVCSCHSSSALTWTSCSSPCWACSCEDPTCVTPTHKNQYDTHIIIIHNTQTFKVTSSNFATILLETRYIHVHVLCADVTKTSLELCMLHVGQPVLPCSFVVVLSCESLKRLPRCWLMNTYR